MTGPSPTEIQRLQENIPRLYLFSFFQMFLVVLPVIVPFWQAEGLTLKEIFLLQGIFGMSLIIFDAPAGYLADFFGRRRMMVVGCVVSALGFQVLWMGHTFMDFVLYEIIVGLGLSLQSGCDVAILYNSLEKLKLQGRKAGYLGRRLTAQTLGEGIASLLGGALAAYSLTLPAYVNAATAWIPALIALTINEPEGLKLPRGSHLDNFKAIGKALFGHSRLLTFAIVGFIFYGFATFCAVWAMQPYWQSRGFSIQSLGYLWAANNFLVALVSRFAHLIEGAIGTVAVVVIIALLPIAGYLGMGYTLSAWGAVFTLAFPICRGLNQVIFQDAINNRTPPEMRATVNSVGSLGMRALFVIFGPLIGGMLDTEGPNHAMKALGVVYVVGFFVVAIPLLSQHRNFRRD